MKIAQVIRFKGTILVGKLDFDLKPGDNVEVITPKEVIPCRIFAITICSSAEAFGKLHESAPSGEEVALMIQKISDKEINPGDELRLSTNS